jgi:predicted KAP-like P-loop ATPase
MIEEPPFEFASHISSDRPIAAAADDLLNRAPFARALAQAIAGWSGKDSLVLAVFGKWGSGKSSIKNMMVEALRAQKEGPAVVEFSPWQFANQGRLTEAFFDQVGAALGRGAVGSRENEDRLLRAWRYYGAYLRVGGKALSFGRRSVLALLTVPALAGLAGQFFSKPQIAVWIGWLYLVAAGLAAAFSSFADQLVSLLEARSGARKQLAEVRADLAKELSRADRSVVVVMDDVDRLTPDELNVLFQIVKSNADLPNLVYCLMLDRDTVEDGIGRVVSVPGRDYLEKIIQVGVAVPEVDRVRLRKVLFTGLDRVLEADGVLARFNGQRWGNLFWGGLEPLFQNLRDVTRFVSTFAFSVAVLRRGKVLEVNPVDLIGLESLRFFEPQVYLAVAQNRALVLDDRSLGRDTPRDELARSVEERILSKASDARRAAVREILKDLFPQVGWILDNMGRGAGFEEGWYRELRVCHDDVFDRYFQSGVPQGDVSETDMQALLQASGDRARFRGVLVSLADRQLLDSAVDRLEAYKEHIPREHARDFVTALFDIGERLTPGRGGLFGIAPPMHVLRIVYWYLRKVHAGDQAQNLAVLSDAIAGTTGLSLPVEFVRLEASTNDAGQRENPLVDDDALGKLKAACIEKVRANPEGVSQARNLAAILYCWRDWGTEADVRAWCVAASEQPGGALALARAWTQRVSITGMGDRVSRQRVVLNLGELERFADFDAMDRVLRGLNRSDLSKADAEAADAFLKAVDRRRRGEPDLRADDVYGDED